MVSEYISNVFKEGELEEIKLFGNSEQLPMMAKTMMFPITILIQLYHVATGSNLKEANNLVFELPKRIEFLLTKF